MEGEAVPQHSATLGRQSHLGAGQAQAGRLPVKYLPGTPCYVRAGEGLPLKVRGRAGLTSGGRRR